MKNELLSLQELQPLIIDWARERNILSRDNATKQQLKLIEELGELASAILKNNIEIQKDSIGDVFVVLVILANQLSNKINIDGFVYGAVCNNTTEMIYQIICNANIYLDDYCEDFNLTTDFLFELCETLGHDLTECANIAWNEIKDRKGKTVNGTFIKN